MAVFERHQGTSPVILGFPHTGTEVPPAPAPQLPEAPKPAKAKSSKAKRTKAAMPPPSEGTATPETTATLADLEAYLAEVTRTITGLFRERDGSVGHDGSLPA